MFQRLSESETNVSGPTLGRFLDTIETPAVVMRTFIGNPMYTTPDALDEIKEKYLGQLDVADLFYKGFNDIPLRDLYKGFPATELIMSARQAGKTFESNCDAGGMSVDTHCGRKQLTVQKYVERIAIDRPRAVIALADEVNCTLGKKRVAKAIERSATWFQNFVTASKAAGISFAATDKESVESNEPAERTFLFGVAQYDKSYPIQLPLLVKHMLSQGAQGMVVGNAHLGEGDALRTEAIAAVRAQLTPQIPTLVQGADTLHDLLLALALGVDLLSTNYPAVLSAKGQALALSPALLCVEASAADSHASSAGGESKKRPLDVDQDSDGNKKKPRTEQGGDHVQGGNGESTGSNVDGAPEVERVSLYQGQSSHGGTAVAARCEMNLWDVKYRKDTRPLVEGCACHACRHHTRAYIHHLHICKEILAEVLVYHHNAHQLLQLFAAARHHISNNSFDSWLQRIRAEM